MKKRIIWIGRTPFRVSPSYKNFILLLALWGTLFWAVGQPAINGADTKTQQYRALPDTTMRQGNTSANKNTAKDKALIQSSHTDNELFLQSLLGAIPVAVFYKDREGLYLGCNDVFTEIMGVTSEEIKGKGVFELWPGELAQRYHQADIELMEHREHQIYQHTITDKSGKLRPVIFGKQVFYDTHGEVAGLVGAFVDITDQQEASMALVHRTIMFLAGVSLFAILMLILFIRLKLSQKKQRIAELEKREIERNYQDIFDSSSNAIFIHDKDTGKILDVNNRMLTLYGYDDKLKACALSVSDLSDMENGHDATKIVDAFLTVNKSGSNSFEWRARKADGEVFWAQVALKKIVIRGVERILAEVRDISANKKQTEELESFFSVNLDLLCIADTEGNFIKTNEAWGEILGYTTEDLNKMKFLDFVHPDDLEATLEAMKNLDKGENILNFTNRYLCKDGSYRYIEWRSHPKGNRIYASARDITAHIHMEAELKESRDRLDMAMAVKNEGIWDWDMTTGKAVFDDRYYTMAGYEPNEFPSNFDEWARRVHPEDLNHAQSKIESYLENSVGGFQVEYRFKHKNGSWIWIKGQGKVVAKDKKGMPLRAIGTHTDITAQKRAEEALQESHKRLESFLHISQTMTSTLEREKLMQMLVDNAVRVTGMDSGAIYLINNKETIMLEATVPPLPPNFPDEFRIAKTIDHPHIEKTIHTGIYTIVADTKTTELSPAEMEIVKLRNLRSNLYLPIQFRDNPIGILILSSVEVPREFSQEVISLLQGFASQAAQIIENIRNFERIKEYTTKLEAEIAERKLTEKKLKESENTLRTFVANQPGVAYITDKEGYFLLSEGQGLQQLGLKPGQVVGLSVFDVYKDIPVIGDTIHKAMKGNEYIFTVNVGGNIFESWIGPILDETGAISGVMGISWDITQRMLAEEQLIKARELAEENERKTKNLYYELQTTEEEIRAANEELKASSDALSQTLNELELANIVAMENAEMYRSLLQTVPDIIIKTDLQGNITFVNDQAVKVISHIPDVQILGRNIFSFIAEEDKIRATENIRLMMDRHIGMQEYKINLHENLTIDAEINGDVIRNANNKPTGIVYTIRDITERKLMEKERQQNEMLEEKITIAEESLKFKQNFLANMSHEIRTPLTGVLGMIDILEQTHLSEDQKDYLNTIKTSGENLREIINQVLDYSKIEAGKIAVNPVAFPFRSLAQNAVELYKNSVKPGVEIHSDIDPDIPEFIEADKSRLDQVLNNFVSNAIKFTHQGSITIKSSIVARDNQNHFFTIKMEVSDTGIGIPDQLQEKLFIPFSQVEAIDTRNYEGTGLGLSICKQLIELMGGEIGVQSIEEKGSTFWFTFLAKIADSQPVITTYEPTKHSTKQLSILLAEDKIVNQKVISLMLNAMGHRVTIASDGQEAIDIFEPGKFDLILMDIQMPIMDGITATQKLKGGNHQELPPIVGLSANAFEGDREKYMTLGMDEYLTKPVKKEEFEGLIEKLDHCCPKVFGFFLNNINWLLIINYLQS